GDHLFGSGLSVAAGHADHTYTELPTPRGRQIAERTHAVSHANPGRLAGQSALVFHHRRGRAALERRADELVAVEALPPQRDEYVAVADLPAVGGDRAEWARAPAQQLAAAGGEDPWQRPPCPERSRRACPERSRRGHDFRTSRR